MNFGNGTRVSEDVRTLRDFVVGSLHLRSFEVSSEAIEAIVDEIWNAPENAHLHSVSRDHRGGSRNGDLEVAPDEWVYLPFPPPPGYEVRRFPLTGGEGSDDAICQKVRAEYAEQGLDFPGGHLTPADLDDILFNAALRTGAGGAPTEVYVYVVPIIMITTDVAPVTDATPGKPTVAKARATPDWLLPLWHWIDRLQVKAEQFSAILQDLLDLCSEGKMIADALSTVDQFLTVCERECKTPPPKSFGERVLAAFDPSAQIFDITDFHAKIRTLRDAAQRNYVQSPAFAMLATFRVACDELAKLDIDPDFLAVYKKFQGARTSYPATEHALQTVLAFYVSCRGMTPEGEALGAKVDRAVNGSPDNTPTFLEIAAVLKSIADNVVAPATAVVGGAPGPLTLLLAFGKVHLLWQLKTPQTAVISLEKYVARAATLAHVPADKILAAAKSSGGGRLLASRIRAAELAVDDMQSSSRWLKALSFMDLVVVVSSTCSSIDDLRTKGWYSAAFATDATAAATAGAGMVAALLQVGSKAKPGVVLALKQAGKLEAADLLRWSPEKLSAVAKGCGYLMAALGVVNGVAQIVQGFKDKDEVGKWSGLGSVMMSMQPLLDLFLADNAAQIGTRVALLLVEFTAEDAAVAAGSAAAAVVAGAATVIGGIGVIIVLGCLVYKNRDAIKAFFEEESTPGPAHACDAYLRFIESSRALMLGPGEVKAALEQARAALEHAIFVNFFPSDKVKDELKADGMSDEDLRIVATLAPFSLDAMAGAGVP